MQSKTDKAEPILEIKNLKTSFLSKTGIIHAVDDISFEVHKGEALGIVGESGSGKSVTALSIMRLFAERTNPHTAGEILFDSPRFGKVDISQVPQNVLRKIRGNEISMIFQEPMASLNPCFTVGFQIEEVLRVHMGMNRQQRRAAARTSE